MKRRTRIATQLGALALVALGATYGLVAQQTPSSASLNTVAAASAAPTTNTTTAPSIAPGATPRSGSSSNRSVAPPVTHTRTRAS